MRSISMSFHNYGDGVVRLGYWYYLLDWISGWSNQQRGLLDTASGECDGEAHCEFMVECREFAQH